MALRNVLVRYGIDVEGLAKLNLVDKRLKEMNKTARDAGNALRGIAGFYAAKALAGLIWHVVESANQLKTQAAVLGISTDELQKYQYVADVAGVSAQQVAVSFRFFNRAVGEAALGTKSAVKVFGQMGLSIYDQQHKIKPTDQLLLEFSDKLAGIKDESIRTAIAMRTLGRGGAALLPILSNGSKDLQQYFKDVDALGGGFTEAFIEEARKSVWQLQRLKLALRSMLVSAIGPLLPVLRKWADRAIALAKALKTLSDRTYAFTTAIKFLLAAAAGYSAIKTILAVIADPVMYAGIALLVGGLTALYVIFDDLSTWAQGGKSVFGDMIDAIGGKGSSAQVLNDLTAAWTAMKAPLADIGAAFASVGKSWLEGLGNAMPYMVDFALTVAPIFVTAATAMAQALILLAGGLSAITGGGFKSIDKAGDAAMRIGADAIKMNGIIQDARAKYEATLNGTPTPGAPAPGAPGALDSSGKPGGLVNLPLTPAQLAAGYTGNASDPNAGLPPPPPPQNITVNNHITVAGSADRNAIAGIKDAAKNGTKGGLAANRNTYDAATAGMPSSVN